MKNKFFLVSLILIITLCLLSFKNNNKEQTFIKDGILFAVTLDGEVIDYFPDRGKYEVTVSCGNAKGKWLTEEWKFVIEDIKGNVSCNLDFSSNPNTLISVVEKTASTIENGHRYSGENPNNYIWFNGEMWRIIGSIPTKNANGVTENLVKIIRKDSIGGLSTGTNTYENNNIYLLLNNYYYGKKDATTTDYCLVYGNKTKCDYRNNGIDSTSFYGKMIENVYWNTGRVSETSSVSNAFIAESSTQTLQAHIGLMNTSDYGYASPSYYDKALNQHYTDRVLLNWLYTQGDEWTSTYTPSGSNLSIYHYGQLVTNGAYNGAQSVRPVVYLDPSVFVVSGTGTEANPYQIAM